MAVALVALWWISALIVDTPLALPSVPAVWHELCVIGSDVSFYAQLGLTLLRSLVAFLLSFAVALVLAFCIIPSVELVKTIQRRLGRK